MGYLATITVNPPATHDREGALPSRTAGVPVYQRRAWVCLEAHLATNAFVPTQRMRCKNADPCPGFGTGDYLDRQYARARGGVIHPREYAHLRHLGILFPFGDAREHDSVVVMRDGPTRAIVDQSPDYATYMTMAWQEALDIVRDHSARRLDLSPLFIPAFHKDASKDALLMLNATTAARSGAMPSSTIAAFAAEGVHLAAPQNLWPW